MTGGAGQGRHSDRAVLRVAGPGARGQEEARPKGVTGLEGKRDAVLGPAGGPPF